MLNQKEIEEILKFIGPNDTAKLTKRLVERQLKMEKSEEITNPSEE